MNELEFLRQKEFEYCKDDINYFIEHYIYIEEPDNKENILQLFKLWESQKEVLKSITENRLNIILKARQLGVTWLTLAYSLHLLLFNVGYLIIALSKTEEDAKELIRRLSTMLSKLGMFIKEDTKENENWQGLKYKTTSLSIEITHKEKSSVFKAFSSSKSAGRSFTANLLILDEWAFQQFAKEIWLSAYPTINRPTGGKVIGLSTIDRGTLFEELYTSDNDFNKIFMPWNADPRRTQEWYETTKRDLGDSIMQEYPATVEEALTIPGGSFFPEFKQHIHINEDNSIDKNAIFYALDYGLDMLAVLGISLYKGHYKGFDEIYESGLLASEAAKLCYSRGIRQSFAPPDLWDKNRHTGKSTAEIFEENGVHLIRVDNSFEGGCINLKEYLKPIEERDEQTGQMHLTANLTFIKGTCPNAERCLIKIQKDKNNPNVYAKEPHELTHIVDALRYFSTGRPMVRKEPSERDLMAQYKYEQIVETIAGKMPSDSFFKY
jgi:hypothetical protein